MPVESPVLTSLEAAKYLRFVESDAMGDVAHGGIRKLHRLVQKGKLKPFKPGKAHVFYRAEVARYIREETYE